MIKAFRMNDRGGREGKEENGNENVSKCCLSSLMQVFRSPHHSFPAFSALSRSSPSHNPLT